MAWSKSRGARANRIAEIVTAAMMVGYVGYLLYHVLLAYVRGAFEVLPR